ncbi:hypothetical protein LTR94_035880, partial [Friedmanniomyces endolithicus]
PRRRHLLPSPGTSPSPPTTATAPSRRRACVPRCRAASITSTPTAGMPASGPRPSSGSKTPAATVKSRSTSMAASAAHCRRACRTTSACCAMFIPTTAWAGSRAGSMPTPP